MRYPKEIIQTVKDLRHQGKTYGEIITVVKQRIPKSTLTEWCRDISLPASYQKRIAKLNTEHLGKARSIAVEINKIKREEFFDKIEKINDPISHQIREKNIAKIALAMLCLGEASKHKTGSAFSLGNSDPKIVVLFIELLKFCFDFRIEKVRCTVQCRADQNIKGLEKYWQKVTDVPKEYFYKTRIDPRTIGIPTQKPDYKGVLKVDYLNSKIQLELESLASLIYNIVSERARSSPVVTIPWHGIEEGSIPSGSTMN